MNLQRNEIQRLNLYGAVRIPTNVTLYLVFILFLRFGFTPTLAAKLCCGLGVVMSCLVNRRGTLLSAHSLRQDTPKFLLACGIGLLSALLMIALTILCLPPELAQIVTVGLTALVIYASLPLFRFDGQEAGHAH